MKTIPTLSLEDNKFAQNVAAGMLPKEAAKVSYSRIKQPHYLMKNPLIAAKIAEYRAPVIAAESAYVQITLTSHLQRLDDIGKKAEAESQYGAAITAEVNRGKVVGLYVDKEVSKDDPMAGVDLNRLTSEELHEFIRLTNKVRDPFYDSAVIESN